jgi:hypothetical protein
MQVAGCSQDGDRLLPSFASRRLQSRIPHHGIWMGLPGKEARRIAGTFAKKFSLLVLGMIEG